MTKIFITFWTVLSSMGFINWITKIGLLAVAFLVPFKPLLYMAISFTALDLLTGVWASYRRKVPFQSCKLYRTINKLIAYPLAIIVIAVFQTVLNLKGLYLVNITAGMIALVEMVSIFENCYKITDEPVFKKIIRVISKKYSDKMDITKDIKDEKDIKE